MANSCGEWQFKEGNTKTVSLGGGKDKKKPAAAASVKGKKASTKKAAAKSGSKGSAAVDAAQSAQKKSSGKKSRDGKKSIGKTPQTPEGGKRTKGSTSNMTVSQYRKYLQQMEKGKKK